MDMIERVARALCEDFGIPADSLHWVIPPGETEPAKFSSVANWTRFVAQARAAIEAMREPTEAMLTALNSYAQCEGYIPEGWRASIDAALTRKGWE